MTIATRTLVRASQEDASSEAHCPTAVFAIDQGAHERLGSVGAWLVISEFIRYSSLLNELRNVAQAGLAIPLVLVYAKASVVFGWGGAITFGSSSFDLAMGKGRSAVGVASDASGRTLAVVGCALPISPTKRTPSRCSCITYRGCGVHKACSRVR